MNLQTKFNIGDKVATIQNFSEEIFKTCSTCEGSGKIQIKDKEFDCPDCYGKGGTEEWETKKWNVANNKGILSGYDKVIKVDIDVFRNKGDIKSTIIIRYILGYRYSDSSCGTLWPEEDVFGSIEEAQLECNKRNKELGIL